MEQKSLDIHIKSVSEDEGIFEAIVAVFGNVDSYGDVVMPGAFEKSLAEWAASGDLIPVIWSHRIDDPFSHIGSVLEAKETDTGLWVRGQLDLENPTAVQAFKLLKGRRLKQFSFGYKTREATRGEREGRGVLELRDLELLEVSPTLIGANAETELLGTKAAVKAGRVVSAKNLELVRAAYEALGELLAAAVPEIDDAKAGSSPAVKTEEPAAPVNVKEPSAEQPANEAKSHPTAELESLLGIIEIERLIH